MVVLLMQLLLQAATVAPPAAADHRVVMADVVGGGRATIRRSGSRLREDRRFESVYSDLDAGLTVSITRQGAGRDGVLAVTRTSDRLTRQPERRLPSTGRRDRALGESCVVSRLIDDQNGGRWGTELCETADGIPLWTAQWYAGRDEADLRARAVSVERRPIRADELRLPDLAAAGFRRAARASPRTVDYEVRYMPEPAYGTGTLRRSHDGLRRFEGTDAAGVRWLSLVSDGGSLYYREDAEGRPLSLHIRATRPQPQRWRPLPDRPAEQLLGERCTWYSLVTDNFLDSYSECRTADDIPLRTETWLHDSPGPLRDVATSLSRRPLTDPEVAAPARALDWTHWGITPAP